MSCSFNLEKSARITVLLELCAHLCLGQPCPLVLTLDKKQSGTCVVSVRFFLPNPLHDTQ